MSTILWSLSIWSKLERWKSSISECLTRWPQIKKIVILKCCLLLFYATTRNRFSIRLWCVMRKEKWIVYYNQWVPAQWLDQKAAPKHFPEPNLHQEEVMVIVWSGPFLVQVWLWEVLWSFFLVQPLNVWSTTTFWTLAKPWHLRSMLSRSMGCTENCNACSQFKRKGPFSTATLKHMPHNQHFKSEQTGLQSFAKSTMFAWLLANQLPLLQATFWRENASTNSRKWFPRVPRILKHRFLCYGNKPTYFLLAKNVLIVTVPILINKDVFEPS